MQKVDRTLREERRTSMGRLLLEYTVLFAVFFAAVFSPFWVYGRSFLWRADGMTQYYPELVLSRHWAKTILQGLQAGRLEVPFWSFWIGFGLNTVGTVVTPRILNFLYCLFPFESFELYLIVRLALGMYFSGLAFLAFGGTRVRNRRFLLMAAMIYLFSGFIPFYVTRHWLFVELTFSLPLMLLGVDRVFERKWSWLFVLIVFKLAVCSFYALFMVTVSAVIYALFRFLELDRAGRKRCGGFWGVLLRHALQYALALGLAAVNLLPSLAVALDSCRTSVQQGVSLLTWNAGVYLDFIRSIVDVQGVGNNGYIALPSIALIGVLYLFYARRKRDRLIAGQLLLYTAAFLMPILTMLFSAFAGKTLRWCYAFTLWAALGMACALPGLRRDGGKGFRFCLVAFCAYTAIYLIDCAWTGSAISFSLVLVFLGFAAFYLAELSDWGSWRRRLATLLLFAVLLLELTVKSYERFSPQYTSRLEAYANAGAVLQRAHDNGAGAMDLVDDDSVFRVDAAMDSESERTYLTNYGSRDNIGGVSSYHNLNSQRTVSWLLDLGNAHQKFMFQINDLDQRTVLDALMGVKYAEVLEEGLARVPYGYALVDSREKRLSDGTLTREYLYENQYPLPIAYAYTQRIAPQTYADLTPNRKEQALLQGVLLEEASSLPEAALTFDDQLLQDGETIAAALVKTAQKDDNLEYRDGLLRVKKRNTTVSIPVEAAEGEIYLLFSGLSYQSVCFDGERAEALIQAGDTRMNVMDAQRKARQWRPTDSAIVSATCGALNDEVTLLGAEQQYFFGKRDVLLNLGYGEIKKTLKLKFTEAGEYRFDDVALICQPMTDYAEKIAPLQSCAARNVTIDGNRVLLEFAVDSDACACLSIPYSASWSATVDGVKAPVVPANGMFMGVILPKGSHSVVFSYRPRGLVAGAAISLASLAALIVLTIVRRLRR